MQPIPLINPDRRGHGFVDRVEVTDLPMVRVLGWFVDDELPSIRLLTTGETSRVPHLVARMYREDIPRGDEGRGMFGGYRVDFLLGAGERPMVVEIDDYARIDIREQGQSANRITPHYAHLFHESRVLGREEIYGFGPPGNVSEEFKRFCAMAAGKVLDFGAGNGDVVGYLRSLGIDAIGLELDEARIHGSLKCPEHVRLYQGRLPLPFEDQAFDCIVSTEVFEHVPDIHQYVDEFARILRPAGRLLLTTPDITSIPSSFPTGTVPWHLLESTHINFFTPLSLQAMLAPRFQLLELYDLGARTINGLHIPGSIGAVLQVKPPPGRP